MGMTVEEALALWRSHDEAREWIESRPPVVRAMVEKMPPGTWWYDKRHRYAIYSPTSYNEDGTVTVRRYSGGLMPEYGVFGCNPDNFEWSSLDDSSTLEQIWDDANYPEAAPPSRDTP